MMRQPIALPRIVRALKPAVLAGVTALAMAGVSPSFAQNEQPTICGPLDNAFGPFDYRVDRDKLPIVERFHFTSPVEMGIRGATATHPGGDIDYTLRAFPNHHRALLAMERVGKREKTPQPRGARYPVECYFDRALRFKANDVVARMIYAQYLIKLGRQKDASQQLDITKQYAEDNPFTHFNIGLLYFDLKDYPQALEQAHKAKAMGFERTELREQLQKVGQWKEAGEQPKAGAAAAAPLPATSEPAASEPPPSPASAPPSQ